MKAVGCQMTPEYLSNDQPRLCMAKQPPTWSYDTRRSGRVRDYGCVELTMVAKTHGMSKTVEYQIWSDIKNRCLCKNGDDFKEYGGRGIKVSEEWMSFENFYRDMGPRPSKDHSVDRIDNSLGYSRENCRWATRSQQGRNKRYNLTLTHQGQTKLVIEWAEEYGIYPTTLIWRVKAGWDSHRALGTPVDSRKSNGRSEKRGRR